MEKTVRITIHIEPDMQAGIDACMAQERRQGREITTAAFIRMAIRRAVAEELGRDRQEG